MVLRAEITIRPDDDERGDDKGQNVGGGEGIEQTVEAKEDRQEDGEGHAEDDLTGQGDDRGLQGLAQSLQIDEGALLTVARIIMQR